MKNVINIILFFFISSLFYNLQIFYTLNTGNFYLKHDDKFNPLSSDSDPIKYLWNQTFQYGRFGNFDIDSEGNIYIVGYSPTILVKYNKFGILEWSTSFTFGTTKTFTIGIDSNNDIYVGGWIEISGTYDICTFLAKYNSSGDLLWFTPDRLWPTLPMGTADQWGEGNLFGIAIDSMDNIYACGRNGETSSGESLLLKYDSDGDLKWGKTWNGGELWDIYVDTSDNIYAISHTGDLTKWDSSGNRIWRTSCPGNNFYSLSVTNTNEIFIVEDNALYFYNSSGNFQWKTYFKPDIYNMGIALDPMGDIYIIGSTSNDAYLFLTKYDKFGYQIWNYSWAGTLLVYTHFLNLLFDDDGNLFISGDLFISGIKNYELFLLKFEPLMQIIVYKPEMGDFYGQTSPEFELALLNDSICDIWYTLNGNTKNYVNYFRGEINQSEWSLLDEGFVNITFYAQNSSGYRAYSDKIVYKDLTPPISKLTFIPFKDINIVNQTTCFIINATDNFGSGISAIQHKINDSDWQNYTGMLNLRKYKSGNYLISYRAIDNVGNVEEANINLVQLQRIQNTTIESYNVLFFLMVILLVLITSSIKLKRKNRVERN